MSQPNNDPLRTFGNSLISSTLKAFPEFFGVNTPPTNLPQTVTKGAEAAKKDGDTAPPFYKEKWFVAVVAAAVALLVAAFAFRK